jgi:16S rRNA (cytosine967-C5)-methyltransferase
VNPVTHKDNPRENALEILRRIEEGAFADAYLEQTRQDFDVRDSAFILELVYGTLRNRALLDWILNRFSAQPVEKTDRWTRNILRLGAYQMLFLDKVPVSAAVNTSVGLAKQYGKKHSYVNALLRNLDRNRGAISYPGTDDRARQLAVLYSHPEWLVRRWTERFGAKTTEAFLLANNHPAPLVIRTNTLRTTRKELIASLGSEGVIAVETKYSPVGLELVSGSGIQALSSYRKGWFMVQDQAAQLISLMLAPQPGETVLDACAAPGGKAAHLAEIMQDRGMLIALDADAGRIEKIRENIRRLGIAIIKTVQGDAVRYTNEAFDNILIDAPCSGLGVLRRHPDGRWTKSVRTISDRRALQKQILKNCAGLLRPGGAFVYATCTTEPEENEDVIADFMHTRSREFIIDDARPYLPPAAALLVGSDGFFRTFPHEPEMDGFFGVRIVRKS